jgi:hypothetical protein
LRFSRRPCASSPRDLRHSGTDPHDGDDLLDLRWIRRIAQPLVARRTTGVESGHGRRRPTSTSAIEQQLGHDPSSGSQNEPEDQASRRGVTSARRTLRDERYRSDAGAKRVMSVPAHTALPVIVQSGRDGPLRDEKGALRRCLLDPRAGHAVNIGRVADVGVGTGTVVHNLIDQYQKTGVLVSNADSRAEVAYNEIIGTPSETIAQNGVQVSASAEGDVHHNKVSRNIYTPRAPWRPACYSAPSRARPASTTTTSS